MIDGIGLAPRIERGKKNPTEERRDKRRRRETYYAGYFPKRAEQSNHHLWPPCSLTPGVAGDTLGVTL